MLVTFDVESILFIRSGIGSRCRLTLVFSTFSALRLQRFDLKGSLHVSYCILCHKIGFFLRFLCPRLGCCARSGSEINEEAGGNFFDLAISLLSSA